MKAAVGRADLVRALAAHGAPGLAVAVDRLGLDREHPDPPREAERAASIADRAAEDSAAAEHNEEREPQRELPEVPPFAMADVWFWRFVRFKPYDAESRRRTENDVRPLAPEDLAAPDVPVPATPPLVPWPRLWRHLRSVLGHACSTIVDVDRLVEKMSRGELVAKVPRRARSKRVGEVAVVVDRSDELMPIWGDQDALIERLRRVLGTHGVQHWTVAGDVEAGILERRDVEGRPSPERFDSGRSRLVLLLGALGGFAAASQRGAWLALGRRLRRAGHRLRALVPGARSRWRGLAPTL